MTPEQKQRIERIRGWQEVSKSTQDVLRPTPSEFKQAVEHIDFLLSLVKSQEAPARSAQELAADIVREWSEHDMDEHYGSDYLVNEFGAGNLEERIAVGITNAATSMRSACVEKVKEMAADVEHGDVLLSAKAVTGELESVSIQEQEVKQS